MLDDSSAEQAWTNQVLWQKHKQTEVYYVPAYLRLKIKNFVALSIPSQQAQINADLLFSLFYSSLPSFICSQLQNGIILQFNRNQPILLAKSIEISLSKNQKQRILSFTLRKNLKCKIDCNFFWSPFQIIYLALVVTIRSMILSDPKTNKQVKIRFNLMDHSSKNIKMSYTKENYFGNYELASKKLKVYYSKQLYYDPVSSNVEPQEQYQLIPIENQLCESLQTLGDQQNLHQCQKLAYFQYAHFIIPMYKHPYISLMTIFFPLWSLSLYNLFVFFQGNDLSMRISNGATLFLALFAFIPTIRDQLPDTPNILLAEVLIYSLSFTFHLTLIQSYIVSKEDPTTYKMNWKEDIFFIISALISIISVLIVIVLSLLHKFIWQKSYLDNEGPKKQEKLNKKEWKNYECDAYFKKYSNLKILK